MQDGKKKDPSKVDGDPAAAGTSGNTDGSGTQNTPQAKSDTAAKSLEKKITKVLNFMYLGFGHHTRQLCSICICIASYNQKRYSTVAAPSSGTFTQVCGSSRGQSLGMQV